MIDLRTYEVRLRGTAPLLCHNVALANPLNEIAQEMKKITANRKKTLEHYEQLAKLEWYGGLYLDREGRPIMPSLNLEGMLVGGAKKVRLGEAVKAAVVVIDNPLIEHDGPAGATATDLWAYTMKHKFSDGCGPFHHVAAVTVDRKRIMRMRPVFREWGLTFRMEVDPGVLEAGQLTQILLNAGKFACLGDYRPKFGKFSFTITEA